MNFDFHNIALTLSVVFGLLHPYIAAVLTKAPTWLTGVITMTLSAISGFLAEAVAAAGAYNWHTALGTAFLSWVMALLAQLGHLSGTSVQAQLHAIGNSSANMHTDTAPKAA